MFKFYKFIPLIISTISLTACAKSNPYSKNGYQEYDKEAIVERFHHSLDSNLSIFPDKLISTEENTNYSAFISEEFFDDNPVIFLSCVYTKEQYDGEVNRLKNISITIKNGKQEYTNFIKHDEESYLNPVYAANDGFASKYEWASLIEEELSIVYLYLDSPDDGTLNRYAPYIKKDRSSYKAISTLDRFTIYNHSFDGGKSYTEFDD